IIEVGIVVMVILIIISFYISKVLNNIFTKYKKSVTRQMQRTLQKEKLLIQQSKMATMGEMIGSIAHQWKQPLSLIGMSNALIRLSKESEGFTTEKEVKEAIDDIDISVNNLAQTIDDFRNFFNPNKQKKYFRFNEVFDKTNKLISSQFKNDDIEFIKNIEDKELFTFEHELSQVLINILKNAKEELIKLDSDIKRFIFVDAIFEDDIYVIRIKDNAGGIPDEIFAKIFDSYFTTKEAIGGTGIGLYISKKIVEENMYGTLEVKNVEFIYKDIEYKGAEFSMYIPI
ncbi:HAMP domain-containing sensor histidine kinase, partial [Sulfurimonas sp.]|uniref:sensor histidine kinase n=1 Tax=Sulfurimonas sp. TaxID=2022749 RepID=UPI0025EDC7C8